MLGVFCSADGVGEPCFVREGDAWSHVKLICWIVLTLFLIPAFIASSTIIGAMISNDTFKSISIGSAHWGSASAIIPTALLAIVAGANDITASIMRDLRRRSTSS